MSLKRTEGRLSGGWRRLSDRGAQLLLKYYYWADDDESEGFLRCGHCVHTHLTDGELLMKKRICLVGFEGAEMVALHSTMASMGGAWDCVFVADAPAALEVLQSGPVDAVVANMHLPGQSGAELLQIANEIQPQALRYILGEVEEQAFIIETIGGAHQFVSRPVQPQELISRIQRGLALDAWLSTEPLRKLTPRLRRLPSLPSTYFELLKQVESPNTSLKTIGDVIARDPAVTVRLLQMVNSAALALEQKVTDPVDAVALLGVETVKSLVLCLQVFSHTDEAKQAGISLEELWDHSCTVANFARQITMRETGDARLANDAFTAGLLHDVGRIVIASNMPREYAAIVSEARSQSRPLHEVEEAQMGVTHAQVGAYLLGLWGMPAPLLEVAAAHHSPERSPAQEFSLLTAVHAANVFAHAKAPKSDGLPLPEISLAHFEAIGLADRPEAWRQVLLGETETEATAKPQARTRPQQKQKPAAARVAPRPPASWEHRRRLPK